MGKHMNPNSLTALQKESTNYQQRQQDGQQLVRDISAELHLDRVNNGTSRNVIREIEQAFEQVTIMLRRGWWITAQEECEIVVVVGNVTQEFKDRIHGLITDYINANY